MAFRFSHGVDGMGGRVFWFQVPGGFSHQDAKIQVSRLQKKLKRRPIVSFNPDVHSKEFVHQLNRSILNHSRGNHHYVFSIHPVERFLNTSWVKTAVQAGKLVCLRISKLEQCPARELDFWFHSILEQEAKRWKIKVFRVTSAVAEFVETSKWKQDRIDLRKWIANRMRRISGNTLTLEHEKNV